MRRSNSTLLTTAYHEAGHAYAAWLFRIGFRRQALSVVPKEDYAGMFSHNGLGLGRHPEFDGSDRARIRLERHVVMGLAGIEAQRKFRPSSVRSYHAASDYRKAHKVVSTLVADGEELHAYLKLLQIRARKLVTASAAWPIISALAVALAERGTLSHREAMEIVLQAAAGGQ